MAFLLITSAYVSWSRVTRWSSNALELQVRLLLTQTHKLVRASKCLYVCVCWSVLAKGCLQLDAYWTPGCWRVGGLQGGGVGRPRWSCLCFQSRMAKVQHEQVMVKQLDRRLEDVSLLRCLFVSAGDVRCFFGELRSSRMIFNWASSLGGSGRNRNQLAPQADRNKW